MRARQCLVRILFSLPGGSLCEIIDKKEVPWSLYSRGQIYFVLHNATGAHITGGDVGIVQVADDDTHTGGGSMYILVVADVNTHMGSSLGGTVLAEEHQIAGLELALFHGHAVAQLVGGGAVDAVTKLGVHIAGQTGTIKALGRAAAVHIGITHELEGVVCNFLTLAGLGGGRSVHLFDVLCADVSGVNLVPAVLLHSLEDLTGADSADLVVVGARAGADVQNGSGDLNVHGLSLHREGSGLGFVYQQVLAGDVAGGVVYVDLIPAVLHTGQDLDGGAVGELSENGAGGVGLRADAKAGALGVDGTGNGEGRGDHTTGQKQTDGHTDGTTGEMHDGLSSFSLCTWVDVDGVGGLLSA